MAEYDHQQEQAMASSKNKTLLFWVIISLGLGCRQAWICSAMFNSANSLGVTPSFSNPAFNNISNIYLFSALVFVACLIGFGLNHKLLSRWLSSKTVVFIAALLVFLGTVAPFFSEYQSVSTFFIYIASGVLTGIGTAVLTIAWGVLFARCNTADILLCSPCGIIFGFCLYFFLLRSFSLPYSIFTAAILPIIEFILFVLGIYLLRASNSASSSLNATHTHKARFLVLLCAFPLCIGLSLGILRQLFIQETNLFTQNSETLGAIIIPITLLFLLSVFNVSRWSTAFKIFIPVVAATILFASIAFISYSALTTLLIASSWICLESLLWSFLGCLSQRYRLSPVLVFGMGRGVLSFTSLLGSLLPVFASSYDEHASIIVLALFALFFILLSYIFVPSDERVEEIILNASSVEADFFVSDKSSITSTVSFAPSQKTAQTPLGSPPEIQINLPAPSDMNLTDSLDLSVSHNDNTTAQKTDSHLKHGESTEMPETQQDVSNKHKEGKFTQKIHKLADLYQLTTRETDVLFELAKGQSPSYIQAKLYISSGTVKTHIRNIYRKLNIHKRQDIYKRIEEAGELLDDQDV